MRFTYSKVKLLNHELNMLWHHKMVRQENGMTRLAQMMKNILRKKENKRIRHMHKMQMQNNGILQIENLPGLHSTFKRPWAIEVQRKFGHLIIHGLHRRIRIHTAPRHIPCWLLKLQIKLSCILQTNSTPKRNQLQKLILFIVKPRPHQQEEEKRSKTTIWFQNKH